MLLVAVLAVLFGILGMHALNNHGTMASPAASGAGHQMSSMGSEVGLSVETAAIAAGEQAAHIVPRVAAAVSNPIDGDHGPVGMLMLCLAMLVVAAIALAIVVRFGKPRRWLSQPRWSNHLRPVRTAVRGTGPPPSWEFSVIRC